MAKCVGTAFKSRQFPKLASQLLGNVDGNHGDAIQTFSLLCLGELGMEV
jgi:hypothetical protein